MRLRLLLLGLTLICTVAAPARAHRGAKAYATPLTGITVDGRTDDWPQNMPVYPIDQVSFVYRSARPDGPDDLTAAFRVGYDANSGLLYLAVTVRDDDLVVHPDRPDYTTQDLCEVYIDGDHSGGDASGTALGKGRNESAQQYVMVPGPGKYHPLADGNPALFGSDTQASGVRAAFRRQGKTTTYEWAIPLFTRFPDERLRIEPGKTIGFDVAVSDADGRMPGNWVSWTPGIGKVFTSSRFGDLVFTTAGVGSVAGKVDFPAKGASRAGVVIKAQNQDGRIIETATRGDGTYQLWLTPGDYGISVESLSDAPSRRVSLEAGQRIEGVDFSASLVAVSGHVTRAGGRPVPWVQVRVENPKGTGRLEATTDGKGRYLLWLAPGPVRITLPDYGSIDPVELILESDQARRDIDFVLPSSAGPSPTASGSAPKGLVLGGLIAICAGLLASLVPLFRRRGRLGGMLVAPARTLGQIALRPDWIGPLFLLLASVFLAAMANTASGIRSQGGLSHSMPAAGRIGVLFIGQIGTIVSVSVVACVTWLVRSGSLWLIARVTAGARIQFYPLLSVVGYAFLPEALLGPAVLAVVASFGLAQTGTGSVDLLRLSTHLSHLAVSSPALKTLADEIEFFALWSLVLTVIGVQRAYDFSRVRAIATVLLYWVLSVSILVGFAVAMHALNSMMRGA